MMCTIITEQTPSPQVTSLDKQNQLFGRFKKNMGTEIMRTLRTEETYWYPWFIKTDSVSRVRFFIVVDINRIFLRFIMNLRKIRLISTTMKKTAKKKEIMENAATLTVSSTKKKKHTFMCVMSLRISSSPLSADHRLG